MTEAVPCNRLLAISRCMTGTPAGEMLLMRSARCCQARVAKGYPLKWPRYSHQSPGFQAIEFPPSHFLPILTKLLPLCWKSTWSSAGAMHVLCSWEDYKTSAEQAYVLSFARHEAIETLKATHDNWDKRLRGAAETSESEFAAGASSPTSLSRLKIGPGLETHFPFRSSQAHIHLTAANGLGLRSIDSERTNLEDDGTVAGSRCVCSLRAKRARGSALRFRQLVSVSSIAEHLIHTSMTQ